MSYHEITKLILALSALLHKNYQLRFQYIAVYVCYSHMHLDVKWNIVAVCLLKYVVMCDSIYAIAHNAIVIPVCSSVYLSVRLSVTRVDQSKVFEVRIM